MNLVDAKDAIRYVRDQLRIRVPNDKQPGEHIDIETIMTDMDTIDVGRAKYEREMQSFSHDIVTKRYSSIITKNKLGMCPECATVAINYLRSIRTDAYFVHIEKYNHVMVVIGLGEEYIDRKISTFLGENLPLHGADSTMIVFCDPWSRKSFTSNEWNKETPYILRRSLQAHRSFNYLVNYCQANIGDPFDVIFSRYAVLDEKKNYNRIHSSFFSNCRIL